MSQAVKCPICGGKGKVKTETTSGEATCHGCFGKGWVEVGGGYRPCMPPVRPEPVRPCGPWWPHDPWWNGTWC